MKAPARSLTATERVLVALLDGPTDCSSLGGRIWNNSLRGRIAASTGGGDYAAQMLLGRMRKAGLVHTTSDPGSSRWALTTEGKRRARALKRGRP